LPRHNPSTLVGNFALSAGGGIYNDQPASSLFVSHSTLQGNSAFEGGGIQNNLGTANLDKTTLSSNTANSRGGGISNQGTLSLTNVTLSANAAHVYGGGLFNQGAETLWNVTMSYNSATTGGALYTEPGHTTLLTDTILAYSPAGGNCYGAVTSAIYTLSSDNSCGLTGSVNGHNPNSLNPLLTALGNYGGPTLVNMLKLGSPAIGGVVGSNAPTADQRDQPRPGPDGSYDIGAVERQPGDSDLAPRLYLPQIAR
jgi:predicted outer membrane repeat protein